MKKSPVQRFFDAINNTKQIGQFQVKVFFALHNPAAYYNFYHYIILILIFINCFIINIVLDFYFESDKIQYLINLMTFFDIQLVTILILELPMRVIASQCIDDYSGWYGSIRYLRQYAIARSFDLFSICVFLSFIIFQSYVQTTYHLVTLRILHFLQIFQFFRIFFKIFFSFMKVIKENISLILMSELIYVLVLITLSYSVYFIEIFINPMINTLFDALWFGVVTLTSTGYGDVLVQSDISKYLVAILSICGFCFISLPASIVGSGLAMKLDEKRQRKLCFEPAVVLVQKIWRYYAIHRISGYWQKYIIRNPKKIIAINDRYAILFISKASFFLALNRFKYANIVQSTGSAPLQYVQLQRKIGLIYSSVRKHKSDINIIKKRLDRIYIELVDCLNILKFEKAKKTEDFKFGFANLKREASTIKFG